MSATFNWQARGNTPGKSNTGGLDHEKINKALAITAHHHPM